MADEEEREAEKENGQEESTKKGGKKLLFIVGGLVILVILIGAPVGYFVFSSFSGDEDEAEKLDPKAAVQKELVLMMEGFGEEDEADEEEVALGAFYPFETIVVNLSGGGYLKCQIHLEFTERDVPKRFYSKLIPIRDELISLLSRQSRDSLGSEEQKGTLKNSIQDSVNQVLRKELVKRVYFTQFVIQ